MSATAAIKAFKIDKESIAYQGVILGVTAGVATFILLMVYALTSDSISMRNREDQLSGLAQVLPSQYYQNDLLAAQYEWHINEKTYQVFVGKDNESHISSYAIQFSAQGFSGPIKILMGVDKHFNILGVRVLEHTETPGLGDKIEIARNNWIRSFEGLSLINTPEAAWAVKKDGGNFDQFTGATITPRAIVKEVHQSLHIMQTEIVALLAKETSDE